MSAELERARLAHEREKRRLEQRFDARVRDILGEEGFSNFMISLIIAAALFAIALIIIPEPTTTVIGGAIAVGLICVVAGVMLAWGVSEFSTSQIRQATDAYGRDEDREDENYLRTIAELSE